METSAILVRSILDKMDKGIPTSYECASKMEPHLQELSKGRHCDHS